MTHEQGPRRLAGVLSWLTLAGAVALPLLVLVIWFLPVLGDLPRDVAAVAYGRDPDWMGWPVKAGGAAISLVGTSIMVWGLLRLRVLFRESAAGRYFSGRAIAGLQGFAWASLAAALWDPVQTALLTAYLSALNPDIEGRLVISLGTPMLEAVFSAVLLVMIAQVLAVGQKVEAENEAFL